MGNPCYAIASMSGPPKFLTRLFNVAHQAAVICLIGSSLFVVGAIGTNLYNRRVYRLERLREVEQGARLGLEE